VDLRKRGRREKPFPEFRLGKLGLLLLLLFFSEEDGSNFCGRLGIGRRRDIFFSRTLIMIFLFWREEGMLAEHEEVYGGKDGDIKERKGIERKEGL